MEKDFLADFTPDTKIESDEDIFDTVQDESEEQDDSPASSPAEKEQAEDDPSQEGDEPEDDGSKNTLDEEDNVPFHKHPRWKEKQQEVDELKKQVDELKKSTESALQAPQKKEEEELPAEWVALYGDDELSRKAFAADQKRIAKLKTEMFEEFKKAQIEEKRKAEEEAKKWDDWVKSEIDALKDDGEKFDNNKLMKIASEYQPTDEHGNISFKKALQIMRLLDGKEDTQSKKHVQKDIAAKTNPTNRGDAKVDIKPSVNTLRNRSFQSLLDED